MILTILAHIGIHLIVGALSQLIIRLIRSEKLKTDIEAWFWSVLFGYLTLILLLYWLIFEHEKQRR